MKAPCISAASSKKRMELLDLCGESHTSPEREMFRRCLVQWKCSVKAGHRVIVKRLSGAARTESEGEEFAHCLVFGIRFVSGLFFKMFVL